MAATWTQKREALREAIAWALRLDQVVASELLLDGTSTIDHLVAWEGETAANRWTSGVWCNLRLSWVWTRGKDETRQSYDEDSDSILNWYGGQRLFNVMVIVASDNQQDMDAIGSATASLRTLIRHPHAKAILQAADIGLNQVMRTLNADYTAHGVRYSQSMTEIRFNTVEGYEEVLETPTAPDQIQVPGDSYVKRVETLPDGAGEFETGVDGEPIVRHIDVEAV